MKFNVGDVVECVSFSNSDPSLTKGKVYVVKSVFVEYGTNLVAVTNDFGDNDSFIESCFTL